VAYGGVEASETGSGPTKAFELIGKVLRGPVDCIAVGLGPGSYTGIRVGISIAQGWQVARGVKVLGISSVELMAAEAHREGLRGSLRFAIDAQRGEFYVATYEIGDRGFKETTPLHIAPKAEGALMNVFPSAAVLTELAATRSDFVSADKLEPIYLRETSFVKAPPPRTII
jgi:tRNA A37 threonylcarbamoyladenosine modification protein TsaB